MTLSTPLQNAVTAGLDFGASLLKLAVRDGGRAVHYASFPIEDEPAVLDRLCAAPALRGAALTGAGARRGAAHLDAKAAVQIAEFDAWGLGARVLLRHAGRSIAPPFLLLSVGTGTPILRVEEAAVRHVGGSPLGGGSALVLGAGLVGAASFSELVELGKRGDRRRVDLLLGDLYGDRDSPLPLEATAAHLGKVPRQLSLTEAKRADLADAVWGIVGDNLALLSGAIAGREKVGTVVIGGSTVQRNPSLRRALEGMLLAHGLSVEFLEDGGHTGARGALELLDP